MESADEDGNITEAAMRIVHLTSIDYAVKSLLLGNLIYYDPFIP